jgi:hypothetical protein
MENYEKTFHLYYYIYDIYDMCEDCVVASLRYLFGAKSSDHELEDKKPKENGNENMSVNVSVDVNMVRRKSVHQLDIDGMNDMDKENAPLNVNVKVHIPVKSYRVKRSQIHVNDEYLLTLERNIKVYCDHCKIDIHGNKTSYRMMDKNFCSEECRYDAFYVRGMR